MPRRDGWSANSNRREKRSKEREKRWNNRERKWNARENRIARRSGGKGRRTRQSQTPYTSSYQGPKQPGSPLYGVVVLTAIGITAVAYQNPHYAPYALFIGFAAYLGLALAVLIVRSRWRAAVQDKQAIYERDQEVDLLSSAQPTSSTNAYRDAATLSPTEFEHEVAWVLQTLYPLTAEVVGGQGDGGIDVKLYDKRLSRKAG